MFVLATLWFLVEIKQALFWFYLWQLKDYHFGRFIDHFKTHKGKSIFLSPLFVLKLILLALFLFTNSLFNQLFYILFLIYLLEVILFFRIIYKKSFKKPIATKKILFLTGVCFAIVALFLVGYSSQLKIILAFDILTPFIISAIVLLFQPISVLLRNKTLRQARGKLEEIKSRGRLKVIAITGSYGKTSTKEFLSTILSKKYKVLKTKEHQNSEIGVAKCILEELNNNHEIFIAEIGAYNKGKVKEVCFVIKPDIGIVTGVNEQHLALFGSLKNLLSAEGGVELEEALGKDGLLIVNGDNKYCLDLYKKSDLQNKKIYNLNSKVAVSDIWTEEIWVDKKFVSFVARNKHNEMEHFKVNVLGKHSIQNLLGAILTSRELQMSFGEISEATKSIQEKQSGMVLKTSKHGINVIDSSYSANPDGVFADLNYLSIFPNKKIIVMPCLIELGKKSSEIHQEIGKRIAKVCDLAIITTKDKFKEIENGFNEAKNASAKCLLCDKAQDIYSLITLSAKSGDAVLLEGRVPTQLINLLL